MRAIFKNLCPNCSGDIEDDRAFAGLPCRQCLPVEHVTSSSLQTLIVKPSRSYLELTYINEQLNKFTSFFEKATSSQPWAAQRVWARRIFSGRSFALIAPTGMGKTVFGSIMALFLAGEKGWKSYILVPTALLAKQVSERILKYSERTGLNVKIAYYHSLLTGREASAQLEKIKSRDYDILVTTLNFLSIRFNLLEDVKFDFIFVDDVDSLLRASKNIDKVLMLLGFDQEDLKNASSLIDLRRELGRKLRRRSFSEASELYDEISKLMNSLEAKRRNVGVLVVSGASIRARRTRHVLLFGELLGFEISSRMDVGRNVADLYVESKNLEEDAYKLIGKLGSGGLIYIPMNLGAEYADKLKNFLTERGVKAESLTRVRKRVLEKFSEGVYDVLIGVASYRSPLVRGIDLPYRVRYALFVGVPKMHIDLDVKQKFRVSKAIILLANIMEFLPEREQAEALRLLNELRVASRIIPLQLQESITKAIAKGEPLPPIPERARITIEECLEFLSDALSRGEVLKALEESPYIGLEKEDGVFYLVVPDPVAYIQASGRTSRMYAGGVSKGLSIVLVDNRKAFNGLMRETRWFIEDINWRNLSDVSLDDILKSVDEDRKAIKDLMDGRVKAEFKDLVKAALFIVESPNKARTIARLFGRPSKRRIGNLTAFEVNTGDYILAIAATGGHIMDLTIEDLGLYGVLDVEGLYVPVYSTIKRCFKCGYTFVSSSKVCPSCGSTNIYDKSSVVDSLRNLAKEVDLVILGTDADAEGEKIAWDLHVAIKPFTGMVKRAEFHEVTRRALREALKNLRDINLNLVEAQITRRIEDRWIGFELSQKLWKAFGSRRLSAGRVQTPVLGWIISRMYESKRSVKEFFELKLENGLKIVVSENRMHRKELRHYIEELKNAKAEVTGLKTEVIEVNPPPPFTTDSMLREASASLGLGATEAMALAQDLFELGLITYHRTDSHRVSQVGIEIARDYITSRFGSDFVTPRVWYAEGAHECIRPTRSLDAARIRELVTLGLMRLAKRLTNKHFSLYELIFRRFIASQMKPVKVEKQSFKVRILNREFEVEGYSSIIENGFNLVRPIRTIPPIKEGFLGIANVRHWRAPSVPLYTQGDVIALMKERGIGRPSTYAKIVETLFERGYVLASKNRKSLIPTRMGVKIFNYLNERFQPFISEETTRKLEEAMWLIENGKLNYQDVVKTLRIEIDGIRSMP
ncbi:MAG: reverse gyrase [Candidatus Bathyarchaeia archaeon]